ncbi:hypothetical protein H4R19_006109, partial [Coemansia spiralis]
MAGVDDVGRFPGTCKPLSARAPSALLFASQTPCAGTAIAPDLPQLIRCAGPANVEAGCKRPRELDAPVDGGGVGPLHGCSEAAPPPARIKLSLKLGALRRQAAAAEAGASDEHIDIDGGLDIADPLVTPPTTAVSSVGRGPRIKLRLSLKGTAADGTRLPRRSWDSASNSPAAPAAPSPGSVVPGSPPDSVASGISSIGHRRTAADAMLPPRSARITYSPSRASDGDSDV